MTNTTKQTIEVEVPEGWEAVGHHVPDMGEFFIGSGGYATKASHYGFSIKRVIIRKKKPILRALEMEFVKRKVRHGELFSATKTSSIGQYLDGSTSICEHFIWREIKGEGND